MQALLIYFFTDLLQRAHAYQIENHKVNAKMTERREWVWFEIAIMLRGTPRYFYTPQPGDSFYIYIFIFFHRRPYFCLTFLCIFYNCVEWVNSFIFTHQLGKGVFFLLIRWVIFLFFTHQVGEFIFSSKLPCPLLDIKWCAP